MAKYHISKEALVDLEEIWDSSVEKWSIEQADKYLKLLFDAFDFISDHPKAAVSIDHISKGYRMHIVQSHLIFYKVHAQSAIEIMRVLHQKMDLENRLK